MSLTVADIVAGHFTWARLAYETWIVLMPAIAAYFAGYQRGQRKGIEYAVRVQSRRGAK